MDLSQKKKIATEKLLHTQILRKSDRVIKHSTTEALVKTPIGHR